MQPVRRLAAFLVLFASVFAVLMAAGAGTAPAAFEGWRSRLAAAAALPPPTVAPNDMKDSLAVALGPVAAKPVTPALLARVVSDDATRYADGVRALTRSDARLMFDKSGTDGLLARGLEQLLEGSVSGARGETLLQAEIDLLRADRATTLAALADAGNVVSTRADQDDFTRAQKE